MEGRDGLATLQAVAAAVDIPVACAGALPPPQPALLLQPGRESLSPAVRLLRNRCRGSRHELLAVSLELMLASSSGGALMPAACGNAGWCCDTKFVGCDTAVAPLPACRI